MSSWGWSFSCCFFSEREENVLYLRDFYRILFLYGLEISMPKLKDYRIKGVLSGCSKLTLCIGSGPINRVSSLPREVRRLYPVPVLTAFLWEEKRKPAVNIRICHGLLTDALKLRRYNRIPIIFPYWLKWWLSSWAFILCSPRGQKFHS